MRLLFQGVSGFRRLPARRRRRFARPNRRRSDRRDQNDENRTPRPQGATRAPSRGRDHVESRGSPESRGRLARRTPHDIPPQPARSDRDAVHRSLGAPQGEGIGSRLERSADSAATRPRPPGWRSSSMTDDQRPERRGTIAPQAAVRPRSPKSSPRSAARSTRSTQEILERLNRRARCVQRVGEIKEGGRKGPDLRGGA